MTTATQTRTRRDEVRELLQREGYEIDSIYRVYTKEKLNVGFINVDGMLLLEYHVSRPSRVVAADNLYDVCANNKILILEKPAKIEDLEELKRIRDGNGRKHK